MEIRAEVRKNKNGKNYRAIVIEHEGKSIITGFSSAFMLYCHVFDARYSDVCRALEDGKTFTFYEV